MASRLSPVYLHALKWHWHWHWHWKCLCHSLCLCHSHCHNHPVVLYCIVLYCIPFCPKANRALRDQCSCFRFRCRRPLLEEWASFCRGFCLPFSDLLALLTVVVNGVTIFSPSFVLRQFMLDCIDWLAALVVQPATPIVCTLQRILFALRYVMSCVMFNSSLT